VASTVGASAKLRKVDRGRLFSWGIPEKWGKNKNLPIDLDELLITKVLKKRNLIDPDES
jgi:hypothetical protein